MTAEPAAPTGRRRALLIATGTYRDPGLALLRAPAGDVNSLAEVLEDGAVGEFEVSRLVDQPTEDLKKEIERFFAAGRLDDVLLLYFSCHGVLAQSRFYFATATTTLDLLRATAIEDSFVNDVMRHSAARSIVLILDCCHSGAFAKGLAPKSAAAVDFGHRFEGRGRVTLSASTALEYAFEETDDAMGIKELDPATAGSLFTRCLVEGLSTGEADIDGDGQISVDELYEYVRDRMLDGSAHQTPGIAPDARSEIVIARTRRLLRDGPGHRRPARGSPRRGARDLLGLGRTTTMPVVPTKPEPPTELLPRTDEVPAPAGPEVHRRWRPRRGAVLAAAASVLAVAALAAWLLLRGSEPATAYDFDGDGTQEIVVAAPHADPSVVVIHSGSGGVSPTVIRPDDLGLSGAFGGALTSDDFDGDGHADLAAGIPGRNLVVVLYGTGDGVSQSDPRVIEADDFDLPPEADQYGFNILARDFDADGFGDLVIGAPGDAEEAGSGALQIIFGGDDGLRTDTARLLDRPGSDISSFGSRLRSGDVDGDGQVDLVEGAPDPDTGDTAGHIAYCPGSDRGPTSCRALPPVRGDSGTSGLAVADINDDDLADIVQSDRELPEGPGGLRLWLGRKGAAPAKAIVRTAGQLGLPELEDPDAEFGGAVDAGQLDDDRYADVVAGTPGYDGATGAVAIVGGGPGGFAARGNRLVSSDVSAQGDRLGTQLAMLRLGGERPDVAVAAAGAGFGTAVLVLRGDRFVELPGLGGAAQGSAQSLRLGRTAGG